MLNSEILRAKNGDEEAIEQIFLKFKKSIVGISRNFYLKDGDSDDLQQEGYIGLMKAIKYYDEKKQNNFDKFAYLCIRRQIITAIKMSNSNKNQSLNLAVLEGDEKCEEGLCNFEKSIDFYSPEEIILTKELLKELRKFLKINLTDMEKSVFVYLFENITYSEIAKRLVKEPKKIDNCIQRIRKKIFTFLQNY